jgi:hypothetical protein
MRILRRNGAGGSDTSPENERIKRAYVSCLREARRHSEPTVDGAASAFHRFATISLHEETPDSQSLGE